jgi:hypothetical protein
MALYRESTLVRIGTPEAVLLWSGPGDLEVPADDVVPEDTIALGGIDLISVPDFQQLINGVAQRLDVTLSGVSMRTIAIAKGEAGDVPGASVDIGTIRFDPDWQQVGIVTWEFHGEARGLSVGSRDSNGERQRSITLTISAGDTTRSRAPMAFFTDADQRRRSDDDAIFDHVAAINLGTSRRWGPK